jgi:polyisoprenoid-binding protein YceI
VRYAALFGLVILLLPWRGVAADDAALVTVELLPGRSAVAIRTYGLGWLPLDGEFTRFHGRFVYDPEAPAHCTVALQVDVSSLAMTTAPMGEMVRGPDFLDAARYPALAYDGACNAEGLAGQLTMHGVTRPFALTLDRQAGVVTAAGRLLRADWGMTARPLLGGSTVRITVTVRLPEAARRHG